MLVRLLVAYDRWRESSKVLVLDWRPYEDLNLGFRLELLFSLKLVIVPLKKALKGDGVLGL